MFRELFCKLRWKNWFIKPKSFSACESPLGLKKQKKKNVSWLQSSFLAQSNQTETVKFPPETVSKVMKESGRIQNCRAGGELLRARQCALPGGGGGLQFNFSKQTNKQKNHCICRDILWNSHMQTALSQFETRPLKILQMSLRSAI